MDKKTRVLADLSPEERRAAIKASTDSISASVKDSEPHTVVTPTARLIEDLTGVSQLKQGSYAQSVWITPDQAKFILDAVEFPETNADPYNLPQHAPGAKLDAHKPRLGLVLLGFAQALTEVGKVGTFGAKKYSDFGWLEVPNGVARYTDALLRHVLDRRHKDTESGLPHAAHAAWCALARLELMLREEDDERTVASPSTLD